MKKVLFGIAFIFCAVSAPETQSYCNDTIKMALAGYIDKTDDSYITDYNSTLDKYIEHLPHKEDQQYVREMKSKLIIHGVWFKQFWRIVGNDPYIANWIAELYAILVYCNSMYYGTNSLDNLAGYGYKVKNATSENVKIVNSHQQLPRKTKKSGSGIYKPDYNGLKNTIFEDVSDSPQDQSELGIKKRNIINAVLEYLEEVHDILNRQSSGSITDPHTYTADLQAIALPYELIYNIRANNRVIGKILEQEGATTQFDEVDLKDASDLQKEAISARKVKLERLNTEVSGTSSSSSSSDGN